MNRRKKLIEVALPLEAINTASAREKSIRHGHPSTLHLWWSRKPTATARVVIFAQMVDDPTSVPEEFPTPEAQERERRRLFRIIEQLVQWENTTNEEILRQAREEIWKSWRRTCRDHAGHPRAAEHFNPDKLPAFHDPFAGGGSLPLEAQRLGLEAYASDLNPVAVLINKAMIEIPPRFAGRPPVNPEARREKTLLAREWRGAQGLAEDVRYYGQWMRDEAEKRIGHLYPKIEVTPEMAADRPDLKPLVGQKLTVIAWLWVRTVKSPNPAFAHVDVPLAPKFWLSTKPGKEAYVEPVIDPGSEGVPPSYRFTVKVGKPKDPEAAKNGTKLARGANFRCIMSGTPIAGDYIKAEGRAGRMGARLMAIVAEGPRGRVYLPPTPEHEAIAREAKPTWKPDAPSRGTWASNAQGRRYGFRTFGDYFTPRQLVALTTFSDLVGEAMERVRRDYLGARASGARASRPRNIFHRTYLPHFEAGEVPQFITFRLHDSLPQELLARLEEELQHLSDETERERQRRQRIEEALDRGHGACHLRNPEIARIIEEAFLHFDGTRYRLHAWVVMPNHVHVLITPLYGNSLSSIVHSWKSFTAKEANKLLGRAGPFWQSDYFDRFIRNEEHWQRVIAYIHENPVRAGLCATAEEWPFSSASQGREHLPWEREHLALDNTRAGRPPSQDNASLEREHLPWEREHLALDNTRAGRPPSQDDTPLRDGGTSAQAYAEAVGVYLAFAVDKCADYWSGICSWHSSKELIRNTFGRQAIPMVWDYAEANPFCDSTGNWMAMVDWTWKALETVPARAGGAAAQDDAQSQSISADKIISTDPPYYDNIGYADLSDFFYVWLRRSLRPVFPDLFATLAVPKAEELVATPYRHGSKQKAEQFFLDGMTQAMHRLAEQAHPAFPVTIYYAFKQQETLDARPGTRASGPQNLGARASGPHNADETSLGARASDSHEEADETSAHPATTSTGWETFLDAVIRAGFAISGTWPMRTELGNRMVGMGTNALASSIVLVCRPRPADAPTATRREFVQALKAELPPALTELQKANIAPVDLAQAAIGPGMAVYTRYARVLDAEGRPVSVREALALINATLDEALAEQEGDFDADTRWAIAWFEQHGFGEGEFGVAETLSKAKNTSVEGMVEAGILESRRGKVRLLTPDELPADWDPERDARPTVWEAVHHLVRALETGGERAAADIVRKLGSHAEIARELAYRLYTLCEHKNRAAEALSYNALVQSWPELVKLARLGTSHEQPELFSKEN